MGNEKRQISDYLGAVCTSCYLGRSNFTVFSVLFLNFFFIVNPCLVAEKSNGKEQ